MNSIVYSIVVPVYNSNESLEKLYEELVSCLKNSDSAYELIFINDGSLDDSWQTLKAIKASAGIP